MTARSPLDDGRRSSQNAAIEDIGVHCWTGGTTMMQSHRRGFLKGTAATLMVAGFAGATRVAAAQTGGMKMKPTAQDVLLVVDVQNCFTPGGSLAVKDGDQIIPIINRIAPAFEHLLLTQDRHTPGHVQCACSPPVN